MVQSPWFKTWVWPCQRALKTNQCGRNEKQPFARNEIRRWFSATPFRLLETAHGECPQDGADSLDPTTTRGRLVAALGLVQQRLVHPSLQDVKLRLVHDSPQAQKQSIVVVGRVIEPVLIGQQCAKDSAQFDQLMPIFVGSGQPAELAHLYTRRIRCASQNATSSPSASAPARVE